MQGLTAWHLYRTCGRVERGESVVVHAAAGGVGSLAVQLGRPMGAGRVIATASTQDKRALALELGADVAIDGAAEGLTERLVEANLGAPVDVVFEMAGGEIFDRSLAALAPFGRLVTYGIASGENNTVSSGSLMRRSQSVVGFWLMHCLGRPAMIDEALADLFARVKQRRAARRHRPGVSARGRGPGAERPRRAAHDRQGHARPDDLTRRAFEPRLAANLPIAGSNVVSGCRLVRKSCLALGSRPH